MLTMAQFIALYLGVAVLLLAAAFGLAYKEPTCPKCKPAITIVYVLVIFGALFATNIIESRYTCNRLLTTGIAAAILAALYGLDHLGGRLGKRK